MRFELKKVLFDRRILALFLATLLVNAILFYQYASGDLGGLSMKEIQDQYQREIDLEEREKVLMELITDPEKHNTPAFEAALDEYPKVSAALERISEAESYNEIRTNLISQSRAKILLGIMGDEESFAVRTLRQSIEDYELLEGICPDVSFFGSIELLTTWHPTDMLLLVFALLPALHLFTYERGAGLQALTHPKQLGRYHLFVRKYSACLVLTICGAIVLYGSNYLIVRQMFGPISLTSPVQSVYGYSACSEKINILHLLLLVFGQKLLWIMACMSIIVLGSVCSGNVALVVGLVAGGALISCAMSQSNLLWIRWLNIVRLAAGEELFQGAFYLNFFGYPLKRLYVCIFFLAILTPLACFLASIIYCHKPVTGRSSGTPTRFRVLHTNLMLQETEKSLFLWHGAVLLLSFMIVQILSYSEYSAAIDLDEFYYRNYSWQLSGLLSDDKVLLLSQQAITFEEIDAQLASFAEKYGSDSSEYYSAMDQMSGKLREKEAFVRAQNQYHALSAGQSYLYETPYSVLLGAQRKRADTINYCKAFAVLSLLFAGIFAGERETGVAVLQVAAGKKEKIFRRKMVLLMSYTLVVAILAFLPRIVAVFAAYGGWDSYAWANSIIWWQVIPDGVTVLEAFTIQVLINYLVCLGAGGIVCFFSAWIGNTVLSTVVSLVCLLIPVGISYLCG